MTKSQECEFFEKLLLSKYYVRCSTHLDPFNTSQQSYQVLLGLHNWPKAVQKLWLSSYSKPLGLYNSEVHVLSTSSGRNGSPRGLKNKDFLVSWPSR